MAQNIIKSLPEAELLALTRSPGAQYLVADAHGILTERYAGFADLPGGIPVTERTTFNTFSITKTATAAAILKLVEQNRVGLDEFVNPMFKEFHFEHPFTIRHLLSHQAGFPNPVPISWIHPATEDISFDEQSFITRTIDQYSVQKSRPGLKFRYSSVGYLLLSQIIEKVSGESYQNYIAKHVIPPWNDHHTLNFEIHDPANHAVGYHDRFSLTNLLLGFFLDRKKYIKGNFGSRTAFHNFYVNGKAYGGLIGNVRGLASYLQLYLDHKIFRHPDTQRKMFSEQQGGMSLGWFTGALQGKKYVCHAGGGGGYYCEIRIYPELEIASALIRNKSGFSDLRLLDKIDSKSIF